MKLAVSAGVARQSSGTRGAEVACRQQRDDMVGAVVEAQSDAVAWFYPDRRQVAGRLPDALGQLAVGDRSCAFDQRRRRRAPEAEVQDRLDGVHVARASAGQAALTSRSIFSASWATVGASISIDICAVTRVQHAEHAQVRHFGLRDATFVEAAAFAGVYAARHGHASEGGFFNPGRREGLKLAFLEASEQAPRPIDWYVQAVSSAMGVYGTYKGARELHGMGRLPRLLCVQQESCAPMARAFAEGAEAIGPKHRVARPTGIAEAILRGDPTRAYPHIRRIVIESGGGFTVVSETEIREARRLVEDLEGLSPCFSAAAAVAGLIRAAKDDGIDRDALVVINLTGSDRHGPPPARVEWLDRAVDGWELSDRA